MSKYDVFLSPTGSASLGITNLTGHPGRVPEGRLRRRLTAGADDHRPALRRSDRAPRRARLRTRDQVAHDESDARREPAPDEDRAAAEWGKAGGRVEAGRAWWRMGDERHWRSWKGGSAGRLDRYGRRGGLDARLASLPTLVFQPSSLPAPSPSCPPSPPPVLPSSPSRPLLLDRRLLHVIELRELTPSGRCCLRTESCPGPASAPYSALIFSTTSMPLVTSPNGVNPCRSRPALFA